MFMYTYIHIQKCIYVYMYAHIHVHIYIYTLVLKQMRTGGRIQLCVRDLVYGARRETAADDSGTQFRILLYWCNSTDTDTRGA